MIIRPTPRMNSPKQPLITVKSGNGLPKSPTQRCPPQRIMRQSPSIVSRTASDYMIHLVPQQSRLSKM